jgi:hypothetical protein
MPPNTPLAGYEPTRHERLFEALETVPDPAQRLLGTT